MNIEVDQPQQQKKAYESTKRQLLDDAASSTNAA